MKKIHSPLTRASLAAFATFAAFAALTTGSAPALAQTAVDPARTTAAAEMSEGVIRKIDREQGKVTLKHGEIKNLDMPGMTMVFNVKDKAVLEGLATGDKVRFRATQDGGQLLVVELVPAP
jgi:Cu(I)/Ag(I) efflux system protein CusF